ncbi:MAG: aminotransferase, partial [Bacteroidetes bacterium]|nr:aminotransferase [Bacteroidota bacterium]
GVKVLDQGKELCGIVVSQIEGWDRGKFKPLLDEKNINTSISDGDSAQTSFAKRGIEWGLRISPHYYNTVEEIDICIGRIREILG